MPVKEHKWDWRFVSCEVATVFCCEECGAIKVWNRYGECQYTSMQSEFSSKEPPCTNDEETD